MENKIHVFENAGLGKAPFQFIGIERRTYQACPGAPVQVGGSCHFCGTGIVECCFIKDAGGKVFIVGNECVKKTGDEGMINPMRREMNRLRAEARHSKEVAEIARYKALLEIEPVRASLKSRPHPNYPGKTLLDYVTWMMQNAGKSGRLRIGRQFLEGAI